MRWPSFERANRFGDGTRRKRIAYALGGCSAVPAVLLAADVGLLAHLMLHRSGGCETPRDWFLSTVESLAGSDVAASGWWGRSDYYLLALLGAFLVLALIESFLMALHVRMADRAAHETAGRLQGAIAEQVPRLAWDELGGRALPAPERLVTEDTDAVRDGLSRWWRTLPRTMSMIGMFALVAALVDFLLTLCAMLLAALALWIYHRLRRRLEAEAKRGEEHAASRHHALRDCVHTVRTMALYSQEAGTKEPLCAAIERFGEQTRQALAGRLLLEPSLLLLIYLCTAWMIFVVGLSEYASLTHVAVLAYAFGRAGVALARLRRVHSALGPADEAAANLFAYLDRVPHVGQVAGAAPLADISRQVRLEAVSLGDRSRRRWLDQVSLAFAGGARVAIVAVHRRTEQAMAQLLLRFRDPDSGRILLDDTDLRTVALDSLRRQTAFAPASGMLFTASVAENIVCGRDGFSQEQVEWAARLSGVFDAIDQLPDGLRTTVGPRARDVCPVVAFEIGLARAVLADPSLVVIEEPPARRDEAENGRIDQAIERVCSGRTAVVLASRLPTLRDADRVYVFDKAGRLHAEGQHAELLKQSELYRHLNYMLFNPYRDEGPPNEMG